MQHETYIYIYIHVYTHITHTHTSITPRSKSRRTFPPMSNPGDAGRLLPDGSAQEAVVTLPRSEWPLCWPELGLGRVPSAEDLWHGCAGASEEGHSLSVWSLLCLFVLLLVLVLVLCFFFLFFDFIFILLGPAHQSAKIGSSQTGV